MVGRWASGQRLSAQATGRCTGKLAAGEQAGADAVREDRWAAVELAHMRASGKRARARGKTGSRVAARANEDTQRTNEHARADKCSRCSKNRVGT